MGNGCTFTVGDPQVMFRKHLPSCKMFKQQSSERGLKLVACDVIHVDWVEDDEADVDDDDDDDRKVELVK